MVAERDLEIEVMKEITQKNGRRPRAPRRSPTPCGAACRDAARARCSRSPGRRWGTKSRLAVRDAPVIAAMRELVGSVSALRLSADPGVPGARGPRDERRSGASALAPGRACRCPGGGRGGVWPAGRPRPLAPTGANQVWAYDFVFDACANGQQLKCLTVIDEWTRECLAIDVAGSIRSARVIEVLAQLVSVHGAPRYLRSDNGPELYLARDAALAAKPRSRRRSSIRASRGRMAQRSFNGKFRDECLWMQWFKNRIDAKSGSKSAGASSTRFDPIRASDNLRRRSSSRSYQP